jgi:hypothetical protein
MYNSQRSVPLFEFRDLYDSHSTSEFEKWMGRVDADVQELHNKFATAPQKKRDVPQSCFATVEAASTDADFATGAATSSDTNSATVSVPASITGAPGPIHSCLLHPENRDQGINDPYCVCDLSHTLCPLPATSAQSESYAYQSIPTATTTVETITTPTAVYTSNCAACTIVGGIADVASCTPGAGCTPTAPPAVPTPTIAAWVGNLSTFDIGNAEDGNGGKDLATEMFDKLKVMCSGASSTCKGDHAEMDDVVAAIAGGEEPLKPAMFLQDVV